MTILERAVATYGKDMQLNVAIEELSELIKEICKNKRGENNIANITEELADCYIVMEQIAFIFNITDCAITDVVRAKIDRLEKRLAERNKDGT